MSAQKRSRLSVTLTVCGIVLLAAAAVAFGGMRIYRRSAEKTAQKTAKQFDGMLPEHSVGTVEENGDAVMSYLSVDGEDVVGLLRYGASETSFPVYAHWDGSPLALRPALYNGSAYNGSMIIGLQKGSDADVSSDCDVGDRFTFTDVYGRDFRYTVVGIRHFSEVTTEKLTEAGADLTLFVKGNRGKYNVILCDIG